MDNINDYEYAGLTQQQIMRINETQDSLSKDAKDDIVILAYKKKK